jgi:hypothetical protein
VKQPPSPTGHLFAIHGDLRRLACDALTIPCDSDGQVNQAWRELLPIERVSAGDADWLRVAGFRGPHDRLPEVDGRDIHLVDTVGGMASVDALVERTWDAVRRAAEDVEASGDRVLPLVALPLVGTGAGGLAHRRGAVVAALVKRLNRELQYAEFDVALVVRDPRDFAAIQEARSDGVWPGLDESLTAKADQLGEMAARGELSLFLGAGVSIPAGLPLWGALLRELAEEAELEDPEGEVGRNYLHAAERIKEALTPERYQELMRSRFDVKRYALGHGLLAGLAVQRHVTTNYDPCMELALEPVLGIGGFRVLTRNLAHGGLPWLLKLHGDIAKPETLVLSESDYNRYEDEGQALYGVVQGLMLTSHLLFVGFSLVDRNFLRLADAVKRVRREAEDLDTKTPSYSGTALALRPGTFDSEEWENDLDLTVLSREGSREGAARILEIFLDRLAWRADRNRELSAQFFLDRRYDEQFKASADLELRTKLRHFLESLSPEVTKSSGWRTLERALVNLGAEPRDLAEFRGEPGKGTA